MTLRTDVHGHPKPYQEKRWEGTFTAGSGRCTFIVIVKHITKQY